MTASAAREASADEDTTTETFTALHTLLARCFEHPDDATKKAISTGKLGAELQNHAAPELDIAPQPVPEQPREAYLRTFEAYEGEFAPPAESAYKEWWDGTERGILSGPPAHDMQRRYDELDAEIPPAYPADHIALLLEYSSLLLEAGETAQYLAFHEQHFDWIPEFRERIGQTGDVPFYEWAVATLEAVLERTVAHVSKLQANGGKTDEQ